MCSEAPGCRLSLQCSWSYHALSYTSSFKLRLKKKKRWFLLSTFSLLFCPTDEKLNGHKNLKKKKMHGSFKK